MSLLFIILYWAAGIAVVLLLSVIFGMRVRDPAKAEAQTQTGVIERMFLRVSGASINGYPCMDLRCDDGKKRRLDLRNWKIYDDLWPGDRVEVVHRLWLTDSVTVIARGHEYEVQSVSYTAEALFTKSYVKSRTKTRHLKMAEFTLDTGEHITLRTPWEWSVPNAGTSGTLVWHGNRLDSFT